jgi:hypothetical protein
MGDLIAGDAVAADPATATASAGDALGTTAGAAADPEPAAGPPPGAAARDRAVHRWRDLDSRNRRWGLAVGAALLLAPLMAFVSYTPDWTPQADPALMGLRALDTGTLRTPVLGQPSQSIEYAGSVAPVHHPGPLHLYLMAVPVRVLGGALGMSLVSVLITGICLVTAAWAVFRQLGRTAGVVAAMTLAAVAFTTGASSLVNPVSSSIAGYPLLVSAVLLWSVSCGDIRLLPVATVAVSFTAQQHLSVVPATAVLTTGAIVLLAFGWWREGRWRDPASRRDLARWGVRSGLVALVLWGPVLAQQAVGTPGNLGQMVWFARHGGHDTLGYGSAVWQVAHVLGLPPLLGRTGVTGAWLITRPSAATWVSAAAVAAAVAGLCLRWRSTAPRLASLGAMTGVVVTAGLVNGSSVPVGLEQARLSFYHWAWVLAFFVTLVIGLALAGWGRRAVVGRRLAATPALAGLGVAVVAVPSLLNPQLDRQTSTDAAAYAWLDRGVVEHLADAADDRRDRLGDHPLLISRDVPPYLMFGDTLAFALVERGIDVRFPLNARYFVHHRRLVDPDRIDGGLVLVVDDEMPTEAPAGELVAEADLGSGFDVASFRALVAAAESAGEVRLGPQVAGELSDDERTLATALLEEMLDEPGSVLLRPDMLAFLADHPILEQPALDPRLAARVLASIEALGDEWHPGTATRLRLYLVDREELLDVATIHEIGRASGDDR